MAWIQIQFAKPKKIVREHTEEKKANTIQTQVAQRKIEDQIGT